MTADTSSELGAMRASVRLSARGMAPRQISAAGRARLIAAAERLVRDAGAERVTVADVCAAAHLSTRTFYAVFADREQVLLEIFDEACERAAAAMARAYRTGGSWVEGVRGALCELLAFLDERPALARFLIVGELADDPVLRARRGEVLAALAGALEADRPPATAGSLPAPYGAEAIVGAVASILHTRLREEPVPSLRDMCGALMGVIVLPYLDAAAARRELARPAQLSAA